MIYIAGWIIILLPLADALRQDHGRILPKHSPVASITGLWFASALAVSRGKAVHGIEWVWHRFRKPGRLHFPVRSPHRQATG